MTATIVNIYPGDLEDYRAQTPEENYLLVDVRQPTEYFAGHITGALNIPLSTFEEELPGLSPREAFIFYCRTGARSAVAAAMAAEEGLTSISLYNLVGGFRGWNGETLKDFPHMELFPRDMPVHQVLYRAMNLEKGAWLFYRELAEKHPDTPLGELAADLCEMEHSHARSVFAFWKKSGFDRQTSFEDLFARLNGHLIEGGKPLSAWLARLDMDPEIRLIQLAEIACEIEFYAYDLYRGLAERQTQEAERAAFFQLATEEEKHARSIARFLRKVHHA